MSEFSLELENAILASGLTEGQLAKASGFSRSYIALMKNGIRVSPDTDKIIRLFDAMNLSPRDYDYLWREYSKERIGKEVYERNMAIVEFIESFCKISSNTFESITDHIIPNINIIENNIDLEYVAKAIMEKEAFKEGGVIRLILQSDAPGLLNILFNINRNNKIKKNHTKIEHIVCMENGGEKELIYNIKALKNLIPVIVSDQNSEYNLYCYYDSVAAHLNGVSIMPYMLISSEYVLCMNVELNKGIIVREESTRALYGKIFSDIKSKCKTMVSYLEDDIDVLQYYHTIDYSAKQIYTIAQQPCFWALQISNILKKYVSCHNEGTLRSLDHAITKSKLDRENVMRQYKIYCTKAGLLRFSDEGIIDELPFKLDQRISIKDRLMILEKMSEKMKNGVYQICIVNEQEVTIPKELFICSTGILNAGIMYMDKEQNNQFLLCERSVAKQFYEFFQEFSKTPQVYDEKQSEDYIHKLINRIAKEMLQ